MSSTEGRRRHSATMAHQHSTNNHLSIPPLSEQPTRTIQKTRSLSLRNVVLLLAVVFVCFLQPISASSLTKPHHAPKPGALDPSKKEGLTTLQQSSRGRHPRWNAGYLNERRSSSSINTASSLHKRAEEHVPKTDTTKAPTKKVKAIQSLAAVNSTNMLCNGRTDLCDLRYNQVASSLHYLRMHDRTC